MVRLCTFWLALALVICAAERADARCAIFLDGDAQLVDEVRAELDRFGDNGAPCLSLRAVLDGDGGFIGVDLRDELGRVSQRGFQSAAGVATFLVSWSQRPLAVSVAPVAPPTAIRSNEPPRVAPPLAAPRPWSRSLELAYRVTSLSAVTEWISLAGSVVRNVRYVRLGGAIRTMVAPIAATQDIPSLTVDALATIGIGGRIRNRLSLRADVIFGGGVFTHVDDIDPRAATFRRGGRAAIGLTLAPELEIELSGGYEEAKLFRRTSEFEFEDHDPWVSYAHIDLGVRWWL